MARNKKQQQKPEAAKADESHAGTKSKNPAGNAGNKKQHGGSKSGHPKGADDATKVSLVLETKVVNCSFSERIPPFPELHSSYAAWAAAAGYDFVKVVGNQHAHPLERYVRDHLEIRALQKACSLAAADGLTPYLVDYQGSDRLTNLVGRTVRKAGVEVDGKKYHIHETTIPVVSRIRTQMYEPQDILRVHRPTARPSKALGILWCVDNYFMSPDIFAQALDEHSCKYAFVIKHEYFESRGCFGHTWWSKDSDDKVTALIGAAGKVIRKPHDAQSWLNGEGSTKVGNRSLVFHRYADCQGMAIYILALTDTLMDTVTRVDPVFVECPLSTESVEWMRKYGRLSYPDYLRARFRGGTALADSRIMNLCLQLVPTATHAWAFEDYFERCRAMVYTAYPCYGLAHRPRDADAILYDSIVLAWSTSQDNYVNACMLINHARVTALKDFRTVGKVATVTNPWIPERTEWWWKPLLVMVGLWIMSMIATISTFTGVTAWCVFFAPFTEELVSHFFGVPAFAQFLEEVVTVVREQGEPFPVYVFTCMIACKGICFLGIGYFRRKRHLKRAMLWHFTWNLFAIVVIQGMVMQPIYHQQAERNAAYWMEKFAAVPAGAIGVWGEYCLWNTSVSSFTAWNLQDGMRMAEGVHSIASSCSFPRQNFTVNGERIVPCNCSSEAGKFRMTKPVKTEDRNRVYVFLGFDLPMFASANTADQSRCMITDRLGVVQPNMVDEKIDDAWEDLWDRFMDRLLTIVGWGRLSREDVETYIASLREAFKKARALNALQDLDLGATLSRGIKVMLKLDEVLLKARPRPIFNVDPKINVMFGSLFRRLHERLHEMWNIAGHRVGNVYLTFAGGFRDIDLTQWFSIRPPMGTFRLIMLGDDSAIRGVDRYGREFFAYFDFSKYDSSQGKGVRDGISRWYSSLGLEAFLVDLYRKLWNAPLVGNGWRMNANAVRRPTGIFDTCLGNSITTALTYLGLEDWDANTFVERYQERAKLLGLSITGGRATRHTINFLKGKWWPDVEMGWTWAPLPSRIWKLGKATSELRGFVSDPLRAWHLRLRDMYFQMKSFSLPPLLMEFVNMLKPKLRQSGCEATVSTPPWEVQSSGESCSLDYADSLRSMSAYYQLSVEEIREAISLIPSSLPEEGGLFFVHTVFRRVIVKDYT
jgi:hypothetical protein